MNYRRLSTVCLDTPISDPADRGTMPMSTIIASHAWLMEAAWDGSSIGDVQIFRNANVGPNGQPLLDDEEVPLPPVWTWWSGVPHGRIKSYRFEDGASLRPMTAKNHAEPQSKSEQTRAGRAA